MKVSCAKVKRSKLHGAVNPGIANIIREIGTHTKWHVTLFKIIALNFIFLFTEVARIYFKNFHRAIILLDQLEISRRAFNQTDIRFYGLKYHQRLNQLNSLRLGAGEHLWVEKNINLLR